MDARLRGSNGTLGAAWILGGIRTEEAPGERIRMIIRSAEQIRRMFFRH